MTGNDKQIAWAEDQSSGSGGGEMISGWMLVSCSTLDHPPMPLAALGWEKHETAYSHSNDPECAAAVWETKLAAIRAAKTLLPEWTEDKAKLLGLRVAKSNAHPDYRNRTMIETPEDLIVERQSIKLTKQQAAHLSGIAEDVGAVNARGTKPGKGSWRALLIAIADGRVVCKSNDPDQASR